MRGEERLLNKDPFYQAQRGMHDIVGLVRDQFGRAGENPPFTYGFAVARSRAKHLLVVIEVVVIEVEEA